jgi:hypothetical protein
VFKKKHQIVSKGRYKLEARGLRPEAKKISHRRPGFQPQAYSFYPVACEHFQKL